MSERDPQARALAQLLGIYHNISYYSPEVKAFTEAGIPGYWRSYMAFRSAPMGRVSAPVVTATFYNFAPRVVAKAIPSAWEVMSPAEAIALRSDCVDRALRRTLGDHLDSDGLAEAADLASEAIDGVTGDARPLYAAHAELDEPTEPHMRLWHACTLWREYRGDGHNIALAAAEIDGLECHVLAGGRGTVTREIIEKIRGWTGDEWNRASTRLIDRGLLGDDGLYTAAGAELRAEIELHTDRLAAAPRERLGPTKAARLIELVDPIVQHLVDTDAVAGSWPPKRDKMPQA